jgi:hypothetical protein
MKVFDVPVISYVKVLNMSHVEVYTIIAYLILLQVMLVLFIPCKNFRAVVCVGS